MRAYVHTQYGGPEHEVLIDMARPSPGIDELLVAVRAAAINPTDWKRRSGTRSEATLLERPVGLGREVSGVVVGIGSNVASYKVGDEVLGRVVDGVYGGMAEFALLSVEGTVSKPPEISFIDAAALPLAATIAFEAVQQLALDAGDTLLVIGAGGGVGIAACQIARNSAIKVIGIASESKRKFVESVGVTHVRSGDRAAERVRSIAPKGIDGLLDLVGAEVLRDLAGLVMDQSRIVSVADRKTASDLGGEGIRRQRNSAALRVVVEMTRTGKFNPCVTEVFPLEKASDALRHVESGHATGKVVLQFA